MNDNEGYVSEYKKWEKSYNELTKKLPGQRDKIHQFIESDEVRKTKNFDATLKKIEEYYQWIKKMQKFLLNKKKKLEEFMHNLQGNELSSAQSKIYAVHTFLDSWLTPIKIQMHLARSIVYLRLHNVQKKNYEHLQLAKIYVNRAKKNFDKYRIGSKYPLGPYEKYRDNIDSHVDSLTKHLELVNTTLSFTKFGKVIGNLYNKAMRWHDYETNIVDYNELLKVLHKEQGGSKDTQDLYRFEADFLLDIIFNLREKCYLPVEQKIAPINNTTVSNSLGLSQAELNEFFSVKNYIIDSFKRFFEVYERLQGSNY